MIKESVVLKECQIPPPSPTSFVAEPYPSDTETWDAILKLCNEKKKNYLKHVIHTEYSASLPQGGNMVKYTLDTYMQ